MERSKIAFGRSSRGSKTNKLKNKLKTLSRTRTKLKALQAFGAAKPKIIDLSWYVNRSPVHSKRSEVLQDDRYSSDMHGSMVDDDIDLIVQDLNTHVSLAQKNRSKNRSTRFQSIFEIGRREEKKAETPASSPIHDDTDSDTLEEADKGPSPTDERRRSILPKLKAMRSIGIDVPSSYSSKFYGPKGRYHLYSKWRKVSENDNKSLHVGDARGNANSLAIVSPLESSELASLTPRSRFVTVCESEHILPEPLIIRGGAQASDERKDTLNLSSFNISNKAAKALAVSVNGLPNLRNVNLSDNRLEDSSLATVILALRRMSVLLCLRLSGNHIGLESAKAISSLFRISVTPLRELHLQNTKLSNSLFEIIADSLESSKTLQILNISKNRLDKAGAKHLSNLLLANASIVSIDASWNQFGSDGASSICESLMANNTVTCINLAMTGLTYKCMVSFDSLLRSLSPLKRMDLSNNRFDERCAYVFAYALMNNSNLAHISLTGNLLGRGGCCALLKSLERVNRQIDILPASLSAQTYRQVDPSEPTGSYKFNLEDLFDRTMAFDTFRLIAKNINITSVTGLHQHGKTKTKLCLNAEREVATDGGQSWDLPEVGMLSLTLESRRRMPLLSHAVSNCMVSRIIQVTLKHANEYHTSLIKLALNEMRLTSEQLAQVLHDLVLSLKRHKILFAALPRIVDYHNIGHLVESNFDGAGKKIFQETIEKYAHLYLDNATGHYRLNLSVDIDRAIAMQILALDGTESDLSQHGSDRADTSQTLTWSNIRNPALNGKPYPTMYEADTIAKLKHEGIVEFDYVSTQRPYRDESEPLSEDDFVEILQHLSLYQANLDDHGEQFNYMKYPRSQQNRSPKQNIKLRSHPCLIFANKMESSHALLSRGYVKAYMNRVRNAELAERLGGDSNEDDMDKKGKKKGKKGKGKKAGKKGKKKNKKGKGDRQVVAEKLPDPEEVFSVFSYLNGCFTTRKSCVDAVDGKLATMHYYSVDQVLKKTKKTTICNKDIEKLLCDVRHFANGNFLTVEQLQVLLLCVPENLENGVRAEICVSLFSRILDLENFYSRIVNGVLGLQDAAQVQKRLGILNIISPISINGRYRLHLADGDEVRCLKMLLSLLKEEKGMFHEIYIVTGDVRTKLEFSLVSLWAKSDMPSEGILEFQYCCDFPDKDARLSYLGQVLIGPKSTWMIKKRDVQHLEVLKQELPHIEEARIFGQHVEGGSISSIEANALAQGHSYIFAMPQRANSAELIDFATYARGLTVANAPRELMQPIKRHALNTIASIFQITMYLPQVKEKNGRSIYNLQQACCNYFNMNKKLNRDKFRSLATSLPSERTKWFVTAMGWGRRLDAHEDNGAKDLDHDIDSIPIERIDGTISPWKQPHIISNIGNTIFDILYLLYGDNIDVIQELIWVSESQTDPVPCVSLESVIQMVFGLEEHLKTQVGSPTTTVDAYDVIYSIVTRHSFLGHPTVDQDRHCFHKDTKVVAVQFDGVLDCVMSSLYPDYV